MGKSEKAKFMNSKVLIFLLVASLALNVFFAAGLFYPRLMGHPHSGERPDDPVAAAAEDFSLDDGQVAALRALRQQIEERRAERRGDRDGFQTLIVEALSQPAFDRAALSQAMDARRESFGSSFLDTMEELHGFLAGLSAEQKAAFLDRVREDRDFLRGLLFPPRPQKDRGQNRGPD